MIKKLLEIAQYQIIKSTLRIPLTINCDGLSFNQRLDDLVFRTVEAVRQNDISAFSEDLEQAIAATNTLPNDFLAATFRALRTQDWSFFPNAFRKLEFLGPDGRFLLIAPYTALREGASTTKLSAIYGSTLSLGEVPTPDSLLVEMFGELRQPTPTVVPIRVFANAGLLAGEAGEAFIVPNGWVGMKSGDGPALNNMDEQLKRVGTGALRAIERIFDKPSSELILKAYETKDLRLNTLHSEYQYHEGGHSAGLGLSAKLAAGALSSPWYGAVEEWRADGVAFEVASKALSPEQAGRLVASNLITRFGIDAHRRGGTDLDTDVNSALLTFSSLLESGLLSISTDGCISLNRPTFEGLSRATEWMRASAVALTRRELTLKDVRGIWMLYASVNVPESVRQLFQLLIINPVHGIYEELR
jgi:hypothetical protein